jgi:hypothetical protein
MNHLKESILKMHMLSQYTFDHVSGVHLRINIENDMSMQLSVIQVLLLTLLEI